MYNLFTMLRVVTLISLISCAVAQVSSSTTEQCYTRYASKAPATVRTITKTSEQMSTSTSTLTETETFKTRPNPVYITVTRTVKQKTTLTQSTKTGVFTTTSTVTQVHTATSTSVFTSVSLVTTTTTATSTVPTAAGFVPLASEPAVIAGGGASKKIKRSGLTRREFRHRLAERSQSVDQKPEFSNLTASGSDEQHELRVVCFVIITGEESEEATTTTTVTHFQHPRTHRSTVLTTTTVTKVLPPAKATSTTTETSTEAQTTTAVVYRTTTLVETATVAASSTSTAYNACQTNNLVHKVGNNYVGYTQGYSHTNYASSEVGCCIQCQTQSQCSGFQYAPFSSNPQCITFYSGWNFYTFSSPNQVVQTMGNGPDGEGTYRGQGQQW